MDFRNPKELAQTISSKISLQKLKPVESDLHWISDIIKTCVSVDPSKRPTPKELIHRFKEKVCLAFEGVYIGQSLEKSSFKFKSNNMLFHLMHDLEINYEWKTQGRGSSVILLNIGWPIYYNKARNLLALHNHIEVINTIHDVLGDIKSVNSVFSQLIENPNLNSYQISLGNNKDKHSDFIHHADGMFAEKISRDIVAEFIDLYLICLVSLIEKNNQSSDKEAISFLANLCFSTNILQESSQICRLAQAYFLLDDFKKSFDCNIEAYKLSKTDNEIQVSAMCFYLISIGAMDFETSVKIADKHITIFSSKEQSNYVCVWQIKYAISLIENGQYVEALSFLVELQLTDIRIMMELICRYYLTGKLFHEIWQSQKQRVFQLTNVSQQKMRMILECAWLYGEREFCIRRAQILLMEPCISLPTYRYYKEVFESFAEGKFPYFSFNEELLKTFEANAEHYYDLFYDCGDKQELDEYYMSAEKAIYNGIALARKMGLEAKVAHLLKRLEFINGVYKQLS